MDRVPAPSAAETGAAASPRRRRTAALAAVWAACTCFYYWTAASGGRLAWGGPVTDYYNQLVDGLLRGHLYLPTAPPKGLLSLSDPYNPALNSQFGQFHDLSLYHGHFYLSWGPSPALTLLMPWRLLHLGALPLATATFVFGALGLAAWLGLFELLLRRYAPDSGAIFAGLGGVVLGLSNVVAYLLRRPNVYEIALTCAYLFTGLGLLLIARTVLDGRGVASGAVGGGCLAIAAGARFELLILGAFVVAGALALRAHRSGSPRANLTALVFAAPWVLGAFLLLLYNVVRFGSPLQIGSAYQLALFDPTQTPYDQLGYVTPSLYYYLIAPLRVTLAFPFVALPPPPAYPGVVPATYYPEIIGGLLLTSPVLLALAFIPRLRRRGERVSLRAAVLALSAVGMVILVAVSYAVPGGTMRYETDFASLFLVAALLVLTRVRPRPGPMRVALRVATVAALLYGALVGVAVSITGPNDDLQTQNPRLYQQLENVFSPAQGMLASIGGGARVVRVIDPVVDYPQNLGLYGTVDPTSGTVLAVPEQIEVVAPSAGPYVMSALFRRTSSAPRRGRITVFVRDGSTTQSFPYRYGDHRVPVAMHFGLNRLNVWVTITRPQAPGALPDVLAFSSLQVTRA